jgi:hypothetical protein
LLRAVEARDAETAIPEAVKEFEIKEIPSG